MGGWVDEVASYPIINYCDGGCGVGWDGMGD